MIIIFRKIRQTFLSENNFSKYLIYSIGEIILIVIGILIALSIDNWNEQQKQNIDERKILTEVKTGLVQDLIDIRLNIEVNSKAKNSCETILHIFNSNTPYNDSLDVHFGQMSNHPTFLPNLASYETLKSKGIDLIRNDSLRMNLTIYYEFDIKYVFAWEEFNESIYPQTVEMYYDNFDNWRNTEVAKPRNYEILRSNEKFKSFLYATAVFREKELIAYKKMQKKCEGLINSIEEELNKK